MAIAVAWAFEVPLWLLTILALKGGRTTLSADETRKGLAWTVGLSLGAFPLMWWLLANAATYNPQPRSSAALVGGTFAGLLFPLYSALLACVAFEPQVQAARRRGAPDKPAATRIMTGLFLGLVVTMGLVALVVGLLLSAGPRALG
jgi:hypothetical protein